MLQYFSSSTCPQTHTGDSSRAAPGVCILARFVSGREVRGFLAALKSAAGTARVPQQQVSSPIQTDAAPHFPTSPGQMPGVPYKAVVNVCSELTCTYTAPLPGMTMSACDPAVMVRAAYVRGDNVYQPSALQVKDVSVIAMVWPCSTNGLLSAISWA